MRFKNIITTSLEVVERVCVVFKSLTVEFIRRNLTSPTNECLKNIPEHDVYVQSFVSLELPMQFLPPGCGGGLVHSLVRCFVPSLQLEHALQTDQLV